MSVPRPSPFHYKLTIANSNTRTSIEIAIQVDDRILELSASAIGRQFARHFHQTAIIELFKNSQWWLHNGISKNNRQFSAVFATLHRSAKR